MVLSAGYYRQEGANDSSGFPSLKAVLPDVLLGGLELQVSHRSRVNPPVMFRTVSTRVFQLSTDLPNTLQANQSVSVCSR